MSDVAWRSVGEIGCPEVSQHVVEVISDLTLVVLLTLLGHPEWGKGAMKYRRAAFRKI
jgi:hypothetical protein